MSKEVQAPQFSMIKKADISLFEIYVEWHYGLGGNPSIESLNDAGSRWRTRTSADRMFYRKRKAIVDFTTWAIRRLKVLYGVQDSHDTLIKNRVTTIAEFNDKVCGKKKKGSKDKKKSNTKKAGEEEIQDDFYLKINITPEWEKIIYGGIPLPRKADINSFFPSSNWHNRNDLKKSPLVSRNVSNHYDTELDEAKTRLGLLKDNAENALIKQILYYLDSTIQSINMSWARIANFFLQMKMSFKKSGESIENSFYDDSIINENLQETVLTNTEGFMSTQNVNGQDDLDIASSLSRELHLLGQFGNISACFDSQGKNSEINISNFTTPEMSPWNMSSVSDPAEFLTGNKRKFSDGTTSTDIANYDFQNPFPRKSMKGGGNEGNHSPKKTMKLKYDSTPHSSSSDSFENETDCGGPLDFLVSASIAKEIKELTEIKSTLNNIMQRISQIEQKTDYHMLAMRGPQEENTIQISSGLYPTSSGTIPLSAMPSHI